MTTAEHRAEMEKELAAELESFKQEGERIRNIINRYSLLIKDLADAGYWDALAEASKTAHSFLVAAKENRRLKMEFRRIHMDSLRHMP